MMDDTERREWTRRVLAFLNHERRRCTYGALAGVLGVPPRSVGRRYLGDIRQEASWVVGKETGMPTGYPPDKLADGFPKDPKDRPAPIDCPRCSSLRLSAPVLEIIADLGSDYLRL